MKRRAVLSIRWVVTATTVALIAASVLGVGAVSERNTRRALSREMEARTVLEARNLALTSAGALLSDFPELTLTPLIKKMEAERPELAFVVVTDHQGRIQGHSDPRRLGETFALPPELSPVAGARALSGGERLFESRELLVVETPVSHPTEPQLGRALVAMRRSTLETAVSAARREQFAILALLLAVGVTLGLVLLGGMLRPVARLREGIERIGRGDLESPVEVRDRTELGLLADAVNDMASRLQVARRETVERERLAHELELAREIQQRLLPRQPRTVSGHVLAGAHRAAAEVGGDYYDYFALPDGRVALAIADVSGKGLAGCLVTSMLAALLRALHPIHASPSALLIELERHLASTLEPGEFVTMFYGVLDAKRGRLVWASAGHMPLLVWHAGDRSVERHVTDGIPLGAMSGGALATTLSDHTLDLAPGDLALQFTDGLSEAFDHQGREAFGFERIERVMLEHASEGAAAVIAALTAAVAAWTGGEPQDDETLLVVARDAGAAEPADGSLTRTDPLERLAEAEASGVPLALAASLDGLGALGGWLERCPDLADLDAGLRRKLELALYEACANVAEHGLRLDPSQRFDLWWVPGRERASADLDARVRAGWFVIRDRGFPFSPGRWLRRDLEDPALRARGRGFGLDLIHLAMDEVVYRPATPAGNVTLMSFDPGRARQERKEDQHGRHL